MHKSLNGLILAGGKSTRMGRDKSALQYHDGLSQTAYLKKLVEPMVDKVFISIRPEQQGAQHLTGYEFIIDEFDMNSPLNGILSAMKYDGNAGWLVIAVDMPHINASAIQTLISSRVPNKAATAFRSPIKIGADPLFAIWEGHAMEKIQQHIRQKGCIAPRKIFESLGGHLNDLNTKSRVLTNVNTQAEYEKIIREQNTVDTN
jgi:molybdenum cofactor guanylyltransferase